MRKYLITTLLFIITHSCFAVPADSTDTIARKKIYHVNRPIAGAIIGVGLFSDYFAISRIKNKAIISNEELKNLNSNLVNPIDRWALYQSTTDQLTYRSLGDYGQVPLILLPGLLAFDKKINKDWFDLLLMYAEGHTITFTFYNYSFLGPTFTNKYRPQTYYQELPLKDRVSGYNRSSFYSGHVASSTYSTFFLAKVYCDYHPEASKFFWYSAATIPPLAIAYFRVRSLDHFPSDCAVGYMLGGALGIIIPELHKYHNRNFSVSMLTSPDNVGLSLCWTVTQHRRAAPSLLTGNQ